MSESYCNLVYHFIIVLTDGCQVSLIANSKVSARWEMTSNLNFHYLDTFAVTELEISNSVAAQLTSQKYFSIISQSFVLKLRHGPGVFRSLNCQE